MIATMRYKKQAVQSWISRMNFTFRPCFYEVVNGRMVRVSLKRGIELIAEGKLEMNDRLREYLKRKQ